MMKNGAVATMSVQLIRSRFHHAITSSTSGRIATEPLLSIANKNVNRPSQYHRSGVGKRAPELDVARAAADLSSNRRYDQIDKREKHSESKFFRCTIQATDSTLTAWMANRSAAKNAPGIPSR